MFRRVGEDVVGFVIPKQTGRSSKHDDFGICSQNPGRGVYHGRGSEVDSLHDSIDIDPRQRRNEWLPCPVG